MSKSTSIRWRRTVVVIVGLAVWFLTQGWLGSRELASGQHQSEIAGQVLSEADALFQWTAPLHQKLLDSPSIANGLLISSSLIIDLLGLVIIGFSIFGGTMRPFLALLLVFSLRQICQALSPLPAPIGMIWHDPGFPSLLVTYSVANDFFFSGHTAIAVIGATELFHRGGPWKLLAVAVASFEMGAVILLRAHYTMDVFTGLIAALLVAMIAYQIAPRCDEWLSGASSPSA